MERMVYMFLGRPQSERQAQHSCKTGLLDGVGCELGSGFYVT